MTNYTFEIHENIGTTGIFGITRGMRYRYHVRDAGGRIVKTGYAITAIQAQNYAEHAISRFENRSETPYQKKMAKRIAKRQRSR